MQYSIHNIMLTEPNYHCWTACFSPPKWPPTGASKAASPVLSASPALPASLACLTCLACQPRLPRLLGIHFLPIKEEFLGQVVISLSQFFTWKKALLPSVRHHEGKEGLGICHSSFHLYILFIILQYIGLHRHPYPRLRLHCGRPVREFWVFSDDRFIQNRSRAMHLRALKVILKVPGSKPLSVHNKDKETSE